MSERDPHLMPIGLFSDTTRLSVKALRIYDDMGLLKPEHVDDSNGYRYYGPAQVARAEAIRTLRQAEMPLEMIGQVLDSRPETRDRLMSEHLEKLESNLAALRMRIDAFTHLTDGRRPLMPYEVAQKEVQNQQVASITSDVDTTSVGSAVANGFGTIIQTLTKLGVMPSGAPFLVMHDVIDAENTGRIEVCVPVAAAFDAAAPVESKSMAGGLAASTLHKGAYDEVAPAYHAISAWIAANGWEPAGPPREVYLNDPQQVSVSEQLTEVLWPIQGANG